jgi:hypothetical protein
MIPLSTLALYSTPMGFLISYSALVRLWARGPNYRLVWKGVGVTDIEATRPILSLLLYTCVVVGYCPVHLTILSITLIHLIPTL